MRYSSIGGMLVLAVLAGCNETGPELAPVSGRITLDGQPLNTTEIVFQPDGMKSPSFGGTDTDGRYELGYKRGVPGALVGWHTVRISVDTQVTHGPQLVPPRYNTESDLRREVVAGKKNEFNFDLTSDKK